MKFARWLDQGFVLGFKNVEGCHKKVYTTEKNMDLKNLRYTVNYSKATYHNQGG